LVFNKLFVKDKFIYGNGLSAEDRIKKIRSNKIKLNMIRRMLPNNSRRNPKKKFLNSKRRQPQVNYNENLDEDYSMDNEEEVANANDRHNDNNNQKRKKLNQNF
jgi:hypothetical protein